MNAFDPTAEYSAIRDGVAKVCAEFPGEYWRDLDARRAYPKDFVDALIRELDGLSARFAASRRAGAGGPVGPGETFAQVF